MGYKIIGGVETAKIPKLDRRLDSALPPCAAHIQLHKSAIGTGVLPASVKGFAVGMNSPDEVIENLTYLTMENSDRYEIVEKYYNKEKMAKK